MGKTRLSLELAARSLTDFPDGVYFVALAELSDALLVPQVVASTLDLHESRGHSSTELLRDYLRGKRVLLVLDNCEHLADAAARLADSLLSTCQIGRAHV